ncbi:MAG TPA: thiamine pyrophosphate-binding protein [Stellaceae bacterium]|jgi:acetolactate synthase-1/2/3 large subunit|nr:thiamine pyrophosphate-binding protein [Stellaceae bacterium]
MNNSDLIVATLRKAGIRHGFGIPSGNVLSLIDAMRCGGIEFILTAHEGSAGFAAEVTGRMTGVPGLCIATLGPGATNLATGVGSAFLDRSPMIAITCNLNSDQLGRRLQMHIDHHALFRPITKASLPLRPGNIAATLAEALRIALSEPQGPVHLDLPEDVALAEMQEAIPDIPAGARLAPPDAAALDAAYRRIAEARRPIAIIGADARRMRDPGLLRRFVERHDIPFAVTTMAKGLIDEDHALSLGCIERACRQMQRQFLRRADLIIGLGYDTVEVEYEAWIGDVPLLHVGLDPADTNGKVAIAHQAIGDIDAALADLAARPSLKPAWHGEELADRRARFNVALRPAVNAFAPHQAIDAVRAALPADGILSFDVGAHTHQIASQWTAHGPRSFLITNGWSSMGFGLPAAIAVKLAAPDRPSVCILGDGCFQMTCGELAVAKRIGGRGARRRLAVADPGQANAAQSHGLRHRPRQRRRRSAAGVLFWRPRCRRA